MVTPQTLIMDVGSTKNDVVQAAQSGLRELVGSFVPAHPIAGKERAGVENADADLYARRQVILTPTAATQAEQIRRAEDVWRAIGSKVVYMTPQAHDTTFAAVSHLPHLLAFAMMNTVGGQSSGQNFLSLAGPGFRDSTRIAAGDPQVWRDIFMSNSAEVLAQCQLLRDQLQLFETAMQAQDQRTLEALITQASSTRAHWRMTEIS